MSEHKARESRTRQILNQQPYCIFCGGQTLATTVDHVPPKISFQKKQWPESFEFPACSRCNGGSRRDDFLFGFIARMGYENHDGVDVEDLSKIIRSVSINYPNLGKEMLKMSTREKRIFSRKTGIKPEEGATYSDLPVLTIPAEIDLAVKNVGAKITKALYYKHTSVIPPLDVGIRFRWFTNAQVLSGESPLVPELLEVAKLAGTAIRNNKSLHDQFSYKYVISNDNNIAVFVCIFGQSFGFMAFLSVDSRVIEAIVDKIKSSTGIHEDKMSKVTWPPINS